MKLHFERTNNRYRGPIEKEKMIFIKDQFISNILQAYIDCEEQNAKAVAVLDVNQSDGVRDSLDEMFADIYTMMEELK